MNKVVACDTSFKHVQNNRGESDLYMVWCGMQEGLAGDGSITIKNEPKFVYAVSVGLSNNH